MRFAKWVFYAAACIGPFLLVPLYFTEDLIGALNPPPVAHPEFYYGFVGVALVWQLAYFMIGTDPVRFRPFMPVALLAKLFFVGTLIVLLLDNRITLDAATAALPDSIFMALFAIAWLRTPGSVDAGAKPLRFP